MSLFIQKNVIGQKFGRLLVVSDSGERKGGYTMWNCQCDCGNIIKVKSGLLYKGTTQSCGCYQKETASKIHNKHHATCKRLLNIWYAMRQRCGRKENDNYKWYGQRGIRICDEWSSYQAFETWALAHGYTDNLSIDRIDNDKNYSPDNCMWVTMAEQAQNRRSCSYERT